MRENMVIKLPQQGRVDLPAAAGEQGPMRACLCSCSWWLWLGGWLLEGGPTGRQQVQCGWRRGLSGGDGDGGESVRPE